MSMSALKREQRTALHLEMSEPCRYIDDATAPIPSAEQSAEGLSLTVRFKSKLKVGSPQDGGVSILEGVESLIFNQDQLDALGLVLESGAIIDVPGYGIVFRLDQPMDPDGPLNIYWTVVRD